MNLNNIKDGIITLSGRTGLQVKRYSPELLLGVGVVAIVASTVSACRATLKVADVREVATSTKAIMDRSLETSDGDMYSEADYKRDNMIVSIQTGVAIGKLYMPAVLLGSAGITAILGAHNILHQRNAALMVAYSGIDKAFKSYQKRVADKWGVEDEFNIRHGLTKTKIKVDSIDPETGKPKKITQEVTVVEPKFKETSLYSRFFDEFSKNYNSRPEYNLIFLRQQQQYMNDLLLARGHVFLNEVYDALDIERTSAGSVVGWALSKDGENFIDFGIYEQVDFVNGREASVLLDFNVHGVIYDLLD